MVGLFSPSSQSDKSPVCRFKAAVQPLAGSRRLWWMKTSASCILRVGDILWTFSFAVRKRCLWWIKFPRSSIAGGWMAKIQGGCAGGLVEVVLLSIFTCLSKALQFLYNLCLLLNTSLSAWFLSVWIFGSFSTSCLHWGLPASVTLFCTLVLALRVPVLPCATKMAMSVLPLQAASEIWEHQPLFYSAADVHHGAGCSSTWAAFHIFLLYCGVSIVSLLRGTDSVWSMAHFLLCRVRVMDLGENLS